MLKVLLSGSTFDKSAFLWYKMDMKMTKQFKSMLDEQFKYIPRTTFKVEFWIGDRPIVWERREIRGSPLFILRMNPIVGIAYGIEEGSELEYWT